jgi:hypothetical protein
MVRTRHLGGRPEPCQGAGRPLGRGGGRRSVKRQGSIGIVGIIPVDHAIPLRGRLLLRGDAPDLVPGQWTTGDESDTIVECH